MKLILVLLVCLLALDLMSKREVDLLPVASAQFLEPVVIIQSCIPPATVMFTLMLWGWTNHCLSN